MASKKDLSKLPTAPKANGSNFEVGYGKPPKHSRFQKGQSGNRYGRPKGAKNKSPSPPDLGHEQFKSVIREEAFRLLGVKDGDKHVELPVIQAVIRSMALNAAKGNQRAQHMFTEMVQCVERQDKALHDEYLQTCMQYKVDAEREIERCRKAGLPDPEIYPHPDHVVIDVRTGEVHFTGPMTKEEASLWLPCVVRPRCEEKIRELEEEAAKNPDDPEIQKQLDIHREILADLPPTPKFGN